MRQFAVDPSQIVAAAGLRPEALAYPEGRIPFTVMGRLLNVCVEATRCAHFGLLAGQQMRLAQLGFPGEMARNSATLGDALRLFCVYHHLNSEGALWTLAEHDDRSQLSYAIYERDVSGTDQICYGS